MSHIHVNSSGFVLRRADYWSTHPDELGTNYRSPTRTKYTGTTPKRVELVHRL